MTKRVPKKPSQLPRHNRLKRTQNGSRGLRLPTRVFTYNSNFDRNHWNQVHTTSHNNYTQSHDINYTKTLINYTQIGVHAITPPKLNPNSQTWPKSWWLHHPTIKGGFRIHTLRSINEPHLILRRLPSRIAYTHRLNPQITEFAFLEKQPTSTGCCSLLEPPMIDPSGQIVEQWVVKPLSKFHDDPTVDEGERADLPRLRNPDGNSEIQPQTHYNRFLTQ